MICEDAFVYQNKTSENTENHYLKVKLKGTVTNTFAVGSKVTLYIGKEQLNNQLIPTRGFQSSVDYTMVFGLGSRTAIDSLVVIWADKTQTTILNPAIDKLYEIAQNKENTTPYFAKNKNNQSTLWQTVNDVTFASHEENSFVDFYQEGLIARMLSREGPAAAVGDVNGDGLDDVFIGGAKNASNYLYIQQVGGGFKMSDQPDFDKRKYFEDTYAVFFDIDKDGDQDLFVGSGGNEVKTGDRALQDRIYINDGNGLMKLTNGLSNNGMNTSVAVPLDYDGDGDLDLFVGSRSMPQNYGVPPKSYLYENQGNGTFIDKAKEIAPFLNSFGMITDAKWVNVTGDDKKELVVAGEWMSPKILAFKSGKLEIVETNLSDYWGWWYTVEAADVDNDGDLDLVLGNRGENFYFKGTKEAPVKLWVRDFDDNKTIDKIMTRTINGKDMPIQLQKEITGQIVSLKKKNLKHADFANKSIQELFPDMKKSFVLRGNYFKSAIAFNDGNGKFTMKALPKEIQLSCVCDIYCTDVNQDGAIDIMMGGNFNGFQPQYSKLDGSFGHLLLNDGKGAFQTMKSEESGYFVRGDVKYILPIKVNNQEHLLTILNNKTPELFKK